MTQMVMYQYKPLNVHFILHKVFKCFIFMDKQYRTKSDATQRGVRSDSAPFA